MKTKIYYGILLLLGFFLYLWTNEATTFLILCVFIMLPILAVVSNRVVAKKLIITLSIIRKGQGEFLVTIQNPSWVPVFHITMVGLLKNMLTQSEKNFPIGFSVGARGKKEKKIVFESEYCGKIDGSLRNILVHDFLGLTKCSCNYEYEGGYLLYPQEKDVNMEKLEMYVKDELNVSRRYLHKRGNDVSEILDIREYQKGDNRKGIHWKLSKKLGYKVVRELDMPANQEVLLIMVLSSQNEMEPAVRNSLVTTAVNVSSWMLEQQMHHDVVLMAEDGALQGKYSVEGPDTKDWFETMLLSGDVNFMPEYVEEYLQANEVWKKYSTIVYVVDGDFETQNQENSNILYVCAE